MTSPPLQSQSPKLSICIATFNRAGFIGATLESILSQTTYDCEVVILDGASTDDTERVVSGFARRFDQIRYVRMDTNSGIDRDYDRAVEVSRGEYCWLMTDDDLLKPGAIGAILKALLRNPSLIVVNMEVKDFSMSKTIQRGYLSCGSNRLYEQGEMDRLFVDAGDYLKYIGGVVIKRSIWLARDRVRYYGSLFIHVGVIFQEPLPGQTLVIAEPFISLRTGNTHTFSPQTTELLMVKWPTLVQLLPLSKAAKEKVVSTEPWKNPQWLLVLRGLGFYSQTEYRNWIRPRLRSTRETLAPAFVALLPGILVNTLFVLYYALRQHRGGRLQWMKESRFYLPNLKVLQILRQSERRPIC